jgi:hypothetical protein
MTYYCERTKHRKIFAGSYWGAFKCEIDQSIIDNRNEFVEEFGIKSYYHMPKYMDKRLEHMMDRNNSKMFDHIETYKTKDNKCVIVNSPYHVTEQTEQKLNELGYVEYKPLYGESTKTYIYITNIGRQ